MDRRVSRTHEDDRPHRGRDRRAHGRSRVINGDDGGIGPAAHVEVGFDVTICP